MTNIQGKNLRERRLALGYSQRELADLLDLHPNTVARYERGEKRIGHAMMLDLALRYLESRNVAPRSQKRSQERCQGP